MSTFRTKMSGATAFPIHLTSDARPVSEADQAAIDSTLPNGARETIVVHVESTRPLSPRLLAEAGWRVDLVEPVE